MPISSKKSEMNTSAVSPMPSPRPTPHFYNEPQTFSQKKLEKAGTPRDQLPPRPPVKSCPPLSRVFPHRNLVNTTHAQPVTFIRNTEGSLLSPKYNENSQDLYFEQMFEDVTPIGYGSFGEVYKVKNREDGKYYAVKKSRERFKGQYDRKRKLEEVAKHESLFPNPNCIRFMKAWEERGHLYIQTELCKLSVSEYCYQNHNIAEGIIWNYMVDLLLAVKHLHDHNLVHMDIKPDNAFISFDGVCKLGDFGLVIDLTKKKDVNDPVEGDPRYLAPELLEGQFGKQADIFSLGIFFLELSHNVEMPRGGNLWHTLRNGTLPPHFFEGRSPELKSVIMKMLEPDYLKRPTVDQVLAIPNVRAVFKTRIKSYMFQSVRQLSPLTNTAPPLTPPPQHQLAGLSPCSDRDISSDDDFLSEDQDRHSNGTDLLDSSDDFLMPIDPPPRRAYTTPALRRRPATDLLNGSPIKRSLFASNLSSTPSRGSPTTSDSTSTASVLHEELGRAGTPPPISSLNKMDCDEPKSNIEPKNLLCMFEAASDEDDDI